MSDGGLLVPKLTPNPGKIFKIERTASLALIMKKFCANIGVNRIKYGSATAASVKHKCYSFTIIMYYLKVICLYVESLRKTGESLRNKGYRNSAHMGIWGGHSQLSHMCARKVVRINPMGARAM